MFPSGVTGFGGYGGSYGSVIGKDERAMNRYEDIRDRAEKKYGGVTSTWRLSQEVKRVAQKYGIGDALVVEKKSTSHVDVRIKKDIWQRLGATHGGDGYYRFFEELQDAVNDCGYKVAIGDNHWELSVA
jgi:hypothetical protein